MLLCYYPIKYYSNNVKINIVKEVRKYFRKTMDIVSVFQKVVTSQKIFKLELKNQKVFGVNWKWIHYYYDKPIISNNRIKI